MSSNVSQMQLKNVLNTLKKGMKSNVKRTKGIQTDVKGIKKNLNPGADADGDRDFGVDLDNDGDGAANVGRPVGSKKVPPASPIDKALKKANKSNKVKAMKDLGVAYNPGGDLADNLTGGFGKK